MSAGEDLPCDSPTDNPFRLIKMEIPKFNCKDPHAWVFAVDEFFYYHHLTDEQQLTLASFILEGFARAGWKWMKINQQLHYLKGFLEALVTHFDPLEYRDLKCELSKLTQTTTVQHYHCRFSNVSLWTTSTRVFLFYLRQSTPIVFLFIRLPGILLFKFSMVGLRLSFTCMQSWVPQLKLSNTFCFSEMLSFEILKENLNCTRNRVKQLVDRKRRDVASQVRDLVLVKLEPFRQKSVRLQ